MYGKGTWEHQRDMQLSIKRCSQIKKTTHTGPRRGNWRNRSQSFMGITTHISEKSVWEILNRNGRPQNTSGYNSTRQLACDDFDRSTLTAHMLLKIKSSIRELVQFPRPLTRAPILRTGEEKACPLTRSGGDGFVLLRTSKSRGYKLTPPPPPCSPNRLSISSSGPK